MKEMINALHLEFRDEMPAVRRMLERVPTEKLSWGNGIIELGTFLAILTGSIAGAFFSDAFHGKAWVSGAILLGVHAAADGKVVLTGMHDMLLSRDSGQTWTHLASEEINTTWYQGVTGTGTAQVLAVGHSGQIVRIAD